VPLPKENLIKLLSTPKFDPSDDFDPIFLVLDKEQISTCLSSVNVDSNGFLHLRDLLKQPDSDFFKIIHNHSNFSDVEVQRVFNNLPQEESICLDNESFTATTLTEESTENLLDAKMVAHILGGSWAAIEGLEGNSSLNTLKYLKTYLKDNPHESLNPDLLKLTIDIELEVKNQVRSIENTVKIIRDMLIVELEKLNDNPKHLLIIPGGWAGLPADPGHSKSKHTGHAMCYTIRKDPDNLDKFIFSVINTGAGLNDYHRYGALYDGSKDKMGYSPFKEYYSLTKDEVTDLKVLSELMSFNILPLRHPVGNDDKRPEYSYNNIYDALQKYSSNENGSRAIEDSGIYITPQRIGNCSWKVLMALIRKILGNAEYKVFINNLKLNTLITLKGNLLKNPTQYGQHQLLMIKALFYGAQKMAKTLEKRKKLFSANILTQKTDTVKELLQSAKSLLNDYLNLHPGKATEESIVEILKASKPDDVLYKQNYSQKLRKLCQDKNQTFSLSDYDTLPTSQIEEIVIPKAYKAEAGAPSIDDFLNNLTKCIDYAKNIKNNSDALRSFLTNNVFDCLPIPPVFWHLYGGSTNTAKTQILDCLSCLRTLYKLYCETTVTDVFEGDVMIAFPEHMYNFAKIFQIGKYLATQYTENSKNLKKAIQPDTFCLPAEFDKFFVDEGQALDPAIIIKWKQLREQCTFRESIFESKSRCLQENIMHESPEFRILQSLVKDKDRLLQRDSLAFVSSALLDTVDYISQDPEQADLNEIVNFIYELNIMNIYLIKGLDYWHGVKKLSNHCTFNKTPDFPGMYLKLVPVPGCKEEGRNLFGNQQLPEVYLSALQSTKQRVNNEEVWQSNFILDSLKFQEQAEAYNLHLIASAAKMHNGYTQLTLLLDYFESLTVDKQNNVYLLEFFKRIFLFDIDNSRKQIERCNILADRVKEFFYKEFNNKDPEDLANHINRYLCFQRIFHKLQNINCNFEENLKTTREKCLVWLNNSIDPQIDRGKVAAYGLASFSHVANLANLSKEDLKAIMNFSIYVGIYGFGKDSNSCDLLLKKDVYDVRLRFAEYMQTCDQELKQELLKLCLQNEATKDLVITKEWQESSPYFFSYDEKDNLIQINLTEGIILVNGMQVVYGNVPVNIQYSAAYKQLFGSQQIEVLQKDGYFFPQQQSLRSLKISRGGAFYWEPTSPQDGNDQYVLLSDNNLIKEFVPKQIHKISQFTYWIKRTNNSEEFRILIAVLDDNKGLCPCFEILSDGIKVPNDPHSLYLSLQNNDKYAQFAESLGFDVNNILKWQNAQGIITKVEFPIGDEHGNWLSFERKEEAENVLWCWTKDPSYFISATQIIDGRPSATNFILLENKEGRQKALFTNISETDRKCKQVKHLDLAKVPTIGDKPDVNGLIIDIKQMPNSQAELSSDNVLSNLYIVYLKIMQPENKLYEASELLDQQRPLRRYSNEELAMLFRIINSAKEQGKLNLEKLHPDVVVTKILAIYLIVINLGQYPMSNDEQAKFKEQYPKLRDMLNFCKLKASCGIFYKQLCDLPKASGRGKLSNFLSTKVLTELNLISVITREDKFKGSVTTRLLKPDNTYKTNLIDNGTLQQLEQDICLELNNCSIIEPVKKDRLERKRISGHKYELTIHDAILLYLKQDADLWKKHVGLDHNNPEELIKIYNIQDKIIKYLLLKVRPQDEQLYNPIEHPALLVYEATAGIRLRPLQIEKFKQLLTENGEQAEKQLEIMMGMGKSKVLSPLLANEKADGKHLSVLVLTDPLYSSGSIDIQKSLSLLGVKVENIELIRQTCSLKKLKLLQLQIDNAIKHRVACTSRVKDLQTIDSMIEVFLEELYQHQKDNLNNLEFQEEQLQKIKILLDINDKIRKQGLFTLDELDSQLYSRHQLNLPIGKEKSIATEGIQVATELFLMLLSIQFDSMSVKELLINNNQTFLTAKDFEQKIKPELVEKIFSKLEKQGFDQNLKSSFMSYMGVEDDQQKANEFYEYLKQKKQIATESEVIDKIAMYKMQLNDGKLQEALSKSSNAQLGRSKLQPELEIVIPYAASNQPKEHSKTECSFFKDPWETVNKTLLYYISTKWDDLSQTRKFIKFLREIIINQDHKYLDFINNIKTLFGDQFVENLKNNRNQWDTDSNLKFAMEQIEKHRNDGNQELIKILFQYLSESVFLEQVKFYPIQGNSSTQDFAAQPYRLNGYSGTRRGEKTWHNRIQVDQQQKTDEAVYDKLLNTSNGCIDDIQTADPVQIMLHVQNGAGKNLANYSSFIDAGALFKEFSNLKVAQLLLSQLPSPKTAVAFYHEVKPGIIKLAVIIKGNVDPIIIEGSGPEQLAKALNCTTQALSEKLFNFYDQAHIIGSDLPNPPQSRALITFSEQLGKDLMNQGIMRMRKFLEANAQHVDFLVPHKVKEIILKNLNLDLKLDQTLSLEHLIQHARLVQANEEKRDYYDSLNQKLKHEIKCYLTTKIRELLRQSNNVQLALELYDKVRYLILSIEEEDLFYKYGQVSAQTDPITALKNKVKNLQQQLEHLSKNFKELELELLNQKLDNVIKNIDPNDLPATVTFSDLSSGEMEVSAELQQELQQEKELNLSLTPAKNLTLTEKLDITSTISLKSILSEKIAKEKALGLQAKWQAYDKFSGNIYYSQDARHSFNEISHVDELFSIYAKPIHQVLVIKEQDDSLKLIVISIIEAAILTEAMVNNTLQLQEGRKVWLVSPNGEALTGSAIWSNPFKQQLTNANDTESIKQLLLKALVLQGNIKCLQELLIQNSCLDWFNSHKTELHNIFDRRFNVDKLLKKAKLSASGAVDNVPKVTAKKQKIAAPILYSPSSLKLPQSSIDKEENLARSVGSTKAYKI
jgi:translation initiation factor 2B subunit (eIF-2B alpha/beta/delta family)